MSLKEQIQKDVAAAIREGNMERRDALRMIMAAIKQVEVDERTALDDNGVQAVLTKQAKQRRESIADYEKAGRPELADKEQAELTLIETYLPQMMSREEIKQIAQSLITELSITNAKQTGQLMAKLMPLVKGKADGRIVNEVVRELLN